MIDESPGVRGDQNMHIRVQKRGLPVSIPFRQVNGRGVNLRSKSCGEISRFKADVGSFGSQNG